MQKFFSLKGIGFWLTYKTLKYDRNTVSVHLYPVVPH